MLLNTIFTWPILSHVSPCCLICLNAFLWLSFCLCVALPEVIFLIFCLFSFHHILDEFSSLSLREGSKQILICLLPFLCFFMTWPFIHSLYLSHFLQLSLQARSHWDQREEEMERGKPKPPRTCLSHAFFSFLLNLSQSSSKYLFNMSHLFAPLRLFLTSQSFTHTISLFAPFLLLVFSNRNICHCRWH